MEGVIPDRGIMSLLVLKDYCLQLCFTSVAVFELGVGAHQALKCAYWSYLAEETTERKVFLHSA